MYKFICILIIILCLPLSAENVYDSFFLKSKKSPFSDTLFERFLWHKKVHQVILETVRQGYYVTILVIPETPDNFKADTYPLHYFFEAYQDAFNKFIWLDDFLKKKGVLKVQIAGSKILSETIISDEFK